MMRTLSTQSTLAAVLLLAAPLVQAGDGRGCRLGKVVTEIRNQVEDVGLAIAERTPARPNLDEICFRVGNLHQTARHELEESLADEHGLPVEARQIAERLIEDGKALPSFCGDREKAAKDPGYQAVPQGDLAALQKELANIAQRAGKLDRLIVHGPD